MTSQLNNPAKSPQKPPVTHKQIRPNARGTTVSRGHGAHQPSTRGQSSNTRAHGNKIQETRKKNTHVVGTAQQAQHAGPQLQPYATPWQQKKVHRVVTRLKCTVKQAPPLPPLQHPSALRTQAPAASPALTCTPSSHHEPPPEHPLPLRLQACSALLPWRQSTLSTTCPRGSPPAVSRQRMGAGMMSCPEGNRVLRWDDG